MPRTPKFIPPPVSTSPQLVLIEWIDAVADEDDGPVDKAGALTQLPLLGYHVRTVKNSPHGPFVVIAAEVEESNGVWNCRSRHSIPTGWIKKWSLVRTVEQIFPPL